MTMVVLLFAGLACAQVRQEGGPVDQTVGDLDEHSTSLRHVQPGLAQFDAASALRQVPASAQDARKAGMLPAPHGQRYLFEAPGFRAYLDRPEYVVIGPPDTGGTVRRNITPGIDGGFLPLIPANTVFDLRPQPPQRITPPADNDADDNWVDTRLDTRMSPLPIGPIEMAPPDMAPADDVSVKRQRPRTSTRIPRNEQPRGRHRAEPQQVEPQKSQPQRSEPQPDSASSPSPASTP